MIILGITGFGNTITTGIQTAEIENIDNSQMAQGVFGSMGLFAIGSFINMIGLILSAIGGNLLFIAHRREITAYTAQQIIPVGKEIVDEVAPTVGKVAEEIAKGIKEGLNSNKERRKYHAN